MRTHFETAQQYADALLEAAIHKYRRATGKFVACIVHHDEAVVKTWVDAGGDVDLLAKLRASEGLVSYYKHRMRQWKARTDSSIRDAAELRGLLVDAKRQINELSDPKRGSFSFLEMEAALCVWEWIIEQGLDTTGNAFARSVVAWRDAVGTVEARHASYEIARYCLAVYEKGKELAGPEAWAGVPYDWEVIPAICLTIDFDQTGGWGGEDVELAACAALERATGWRRDTSSAQPRGIHHDHSLDTAAYVNSAESVRSGVFYVPVSCPCGDNDGHWCSLDYCPFPKPVTGTAAAEQEVMKVLRPFIGKTYTRKLLDEIVEAVLSIGNAPTRRPASELPILNFDIEARD